MASDNHDSTLTAHHQPNAIANANANASPISFKPDAPPLLKRSKTITVDTSQTPHFPGPLFPAVRRVSTAPLSASAFRQPTDLRLSIDNDPSAPDTAQFFNRDYIFPSCLGPYASKSRLTHKHALSTSTTSSSSNRRLASLEQSPPIAPPSKVQESKKQVKLIGRPDSASQSSMRRSWTPTHSLIHYLVSVLIFTLFSCLLPQFSFLEIGENGYLQF